MNLPLFTLFISWIQTAKSDNWFQGGGECFSTLQDGLESG